MVPLSLLTIAPEILDLIVEDINDKRDLLNFGRTCKFLCYKAFVVIYKDIHLERRHRAHDPSRTVLPRFTADGPNRSTTARLISEQLLPGRGVGSFVKSLRIEDKGIAGHQYQDAKFRLRWVSDGHDQLSGWVSVIKSISDEWQAQRDYEVPEDLREAHSKAFNGVLRDGLSSMPNLRRFKLGPVSEIEKETVSALNRMTAEGRLREIEFEFAEYMNRYRDPKNYPYISDHVDSAKVVYHPDFCHVSVVGFRNLSSLKLFKLYGDLSRYIKDIAEVLIENRKTLREIGFSTSDAKQEELDLNQVANEQHGYRHDEEEEGWEYPADDFYKEIWHKLCARYVRKAIRLPGASEYSYDKLRIESLILGDGFGLFLNPKTTPRDRDMVAMALDLKRLQKLEWENIESDNLVPFYNDHDELRSTNRAWGTFIGCDNLQDIEVRYIHEDIFCRFLKMRSPYSKPLVRFVGREYDRNEQWQDPNFLPYLLSDRLKVLDIRLPKSKMAEIKNAPNLETVFINVKDTEAFNDKNAPEAKGNPLRHFLPLTKLRSLGFMDYKISWDQTSDSDSALVYIIAQMNDGHWKHLQEIRLVTIEWDKTRYDVVRKLDSPVTLRKRTTP